MKNLKLLIIAVATVMLMNACSPAEGNDTGHEYMPDMAHSIAYEANVHSYYYYNTLNDASTLSLKALSHPRLPVPGTIPRGYAGVYYAANSTAQNTMMERLHGQTGLNEISVPLNGEVPFYYENTEEERLRATAEIIENPFPIESEGLVRGKALYDIFCAICHGADGGGQGYLVSEENPGAVYPAQPANLLSDEFVQASNGRYYFVIMHGKNVMGPYGDKLSYEERWQVIHHIRSLQAKQAELAYSETENTFNPAFGTPGASMRQAIADNALSPEDDEEEVSTPPENQRTNEDDREDEIEGDGGGPDSDDQQDEGGSR